MHKYAKRYLVDRNIILFLHKLHIAMTQLPGGTWKQTEKSQFTFGKTLEMQIIQVLLINLCKPDTQEVCKILYWYELDLVRHIYSKHLKSHFKNVLSFIPDYRLSSFEI